MAHLRAADLKTPLVYVSDFTNDVIDVFSQGGALVAQISLGPATAPYQPGRLATDASGNLYATSFAGPQVYVFAPGAATPKLILTPPGNATGAPVAVARSGEVVAGVSSQTAPTYAFFKAGQTAAYKTVSCSLLASAFGQAYDQKGNLYLDGSVSSNAYLIAEIPAGGSSCRSTGITPASPGALAFDAAGDLLVEDANGYPTMALYPHGRPPASETYSWAPPGNTMVFSSTQTALWACDVTNKVVDEYAYPSGKLTQAIFIPSGYYGTGNPFDIAVSPWSAP